MAMAQSFTESGSDEVTDGIVDICSYCATDGKLQPATHFCFDCGVYGRYICGICLRNHNKFVNSHTAERIAVQSNSGRKQLQTDLAAERQTSESMAKKLTEALRELEIQKEKRKTMEQELFEERENVKSQKHRLNDRENMLKELEHDMKNKDSNLIKLEEEAAHLAKRFKEEHIKWTNVTRDLEYTQKMKEQLEAQVNEYASQELAYKKTFEEMNLVYKKQLEKEKCQAEKARQRDKDHFQEMMEDEKRKFDDKYKKLLFERDDLRDRFSKLAVAKLQETNADLSDPNRAMKLSERFGQLFDDEWTIALGCLMDKKSALPLKHAIALLLRFLHECWSFCNTLVTTQLESLQSVFLHPAEKLANLNQKQIVCGLKDRPRIGSKDDKTLFALRRQIGVSPTVIEDVKQALLSECKTWNKEKGYEKKHVEACAPYLQKCAEICWLMALHDPQLYMEMDVKPGEKLNPNIYSVYSSSGNTIDFLVWPPLFNGIDGGLLAKGVAEPQRTVGKKK